MEETAAIVALVGSGLGFLAAIFAAWARLLGSHHRKRLLEITRKNGDLIEIIDVGAIDKEEDKLDRALAEIHRTKQLARSG